MGLGSYVTSARPCPPLSLLVQFESLKTLATPASALLIGSCITETQLNRIISSELQAPLRICVKSEPRGERENYANHDDSKHERYACLPTFGALSVNHPHPNSGRYRGRPCKQEVYEGLPLGRLYGQAPQARYCGHQEARMSRPNTQASYNLI